MQINSDCFVYAKRFTLDTALLVVSAARLPESVYLNRSSPE